MAALNQRIRQVLSLFLPDLAGVLEPDAADPSETRSTPTLPLTLIPSSV